MDFDQAENSLRELHEMYAPIKPCTRVDISLADFSEPHIYHIHSIFEIKWVPEADSFSEAQACASANIFHKAKCCTHPWIPIFVLTKSSYQLGIGYKAFGPRWAFSEIFECSNELPFCPTSNTNMLQLLHFFDFSVTSANFHRAFNVADVRHKCFVNQAGDITLLDYRVISDRVLLGRRPCVQNPRSFENKVLKFYENRAAAVDALERQNAALLLLGIGNEAHPELVEGCGADNLNGMCAVIDDYFARRSEEIMLDHLIALTEMVDKLHQNNWVHGDLRLPNIIFLGSGGVRLIDFDWSGRAGTISFPSKADAGAFGAIASQLVSPWETIPADFDWRCLADILVLGGRDTAALDDEGCSKDDVVAALQYRRNAGAGRTPFPKQQRCPLAINLVSLGGRLEAYYSKKISLGEEPAKRRKRRRVDRSRRSRDGSVWQ